jgi:hypothetical protein
LQREELEDELHSVKYQMQNVEHVDSGIKRFFYLLSDSSVCLLFRFDDVSNCQYMVVFHLQAFGREGKRPRRSTEAYTDP